MLGGKPRAFPALQEALTDPDLGKFGFAKPPAASQYFVAMRLQGPVGPNLSGMHCSQRDHGLRLFFTDNLLLMTILKPYSVLVDEGFELQGELQPVAGVIHPGEVSVRRERNREDQSPPRQVSKSQLGRFRCLVRARGSFARRSGRGNQGSNPLR